MDEQRSLVLLAAEDCLGLIEYHVYLHRDCPCQLYPLPSLVAYY